MRRVWAAGAALACLASMATPADAAVASTMAGTDVAVTTLATRTQIRPGHDVTLTVSATNLGPLPAADVVITNPLPTSLTLVSSSISAGHHDAALANWTVGALAVGETATLSVVVRAQARGQVVYPAALVASTPTDGNDLNNVDSVSIEILPPSADLVIAQVVAPAAQPGDTVTWTITALNAGPDNVDGAIVRTLGLELVSVTTSVGTFSPVNQAWQVGRLVVGDPSATLTAQVRIGASGTHAGTVVIEATGTADPDLANNVASATVGSSAPPLDIVVVATEDIMGVHRGQDLTFTVTAANNGPTSATGLVVADRLPPGYAFVDATGPGRYDPVTSLWTIGDLGAGSSATLELTASATAAAASSSINAAVLSRVDQWDSDPRTNSAQTTATVDDRADLEITTDVVPDMVESGDTVTTTVTVTNPGRHEASTVEAAVLENPGAAVVDSQSTTVFDRARRVWTIGALGPGQSTTLVLRQRVTRPGVTINTAQIIQTGTPDPDLGNNIARGVVPLPSTDVVVLARADVARVGVGGEVVFTIVATNVGPYPAHGVSVINMLPSQLSLVEASTTVGSYDRATGVWVIGELLPGEIQSLRLQTIASWPGDVRMHAVITSTGPIESNEGNNSAESLLTIVAGPAPVDPGPGPAGLAARGELGWWLTSSGAIGLFLVLAGAALILARRREPLSDL